MCLIVLLKVSLEKEPSVSIVHTPNWVYVPGILETVGVNLPFVAARFNIAKTVQPLHSMVAPVAVATLCRKTSQPKGLPSRIFRGQCFPLQ
jgi:hypothetical protein